MGQRLSPTLITHARSNARPASTGVRCGGGEGKGEEEADVGHPSTLYSCDTTSDHAHFGGMVTYDY